MPMVKCLMSIIQELLINSYICLKFDKIDSTDFLK